MQGDDIKLLQQELRQLGFMIPEDEVSFGKNTRKALLEFQRKFGLLNEPNIKAGVVDDRTAPKINEEIEKLSSTEDLLVPGYVRQVDGTPITDTLVVAFDKDLRHEEPLGRAVTDQNGNYEISYTSDKFSRVEKERADLIVRAIDSAGKGIVSSDEILGTPIFNAPVVATVNLVVGGREYLGPSEYKQLLDIINPLLDGTSWDGLKEDQEIKAGVSDKKRIQDITFLHW